MDNNLLPILQKRLFDDWKNKKNISGKKLYSVEDKKFIERLLNENLCEYEIDDNGNVKADIKSLNFEDSPSDIVENNLKEDMALLDICSKMYLDGNLDIENIARQFYKNISNDTMKFDDLSDSDKNYYYNEIKICIDIIEEFNKK